MLQVPFGCGEGRFGLSCPSPLAEALSQPRGDAEPASELFSVHTAWPPSLASKPADESKAGKIVG